MSKLCREKTIVTPTPTQAGILTQHNQKLYNLLQTLQHDVATVRVQRNKLQDIAKQLIEHRSKLIEDLANQRIQFTTQFGSKSAEVTTANTLLIRALQEQIERAEQHCEQHLTNAA